MIQVRDNKGRIVQSLDEGIVEVLTMDGALIQVTIAGKSFTSVLSPGDEAMTQHAAAFKLPVAKVTTNIT